MVEATPGLADSIAMSAFSPEQTLVLAAIERFMADPDLVALDDASDDGEILDVILRALELVMPEQEIELAVTGLLASATAGLDEETQLVLEALLAALEQQEEDPPGLEDLLERESAVILANAQRNDGLLVWDPAGEPFLQELGILQLLETYPCRGAAARWTADEFVRFLEVKGQEWRRTALALQILEELPHTRPTAGTVILVVPPEAGEPMVQLEVAVALDPSG
jgi:hypothetical protein